MKRLVCLALFAFACGDDPTQRRIEILPDMVDSIAYDAFAPNPNTRDGKTLQAPAPNTIPRGHQPFHYQPGPPEAARAAKEVASPIPPSEATVARGKQVYGTFCTPCHGLTGQGDGPVIPKFPAPPPLTAPHAKQLADGQLFHIITHGQGLMPPHGTQVRPRDRWMAVHYIRSMQSEGGKK